MPRLHVQDVSEMLALQTEMQCQGTFPYSNIPFPEVAGRQIPGDNQPFLKIIAGDASDRKFYRLHNSPTNAICMRFPKWEGGYGGDPLSWLGMHAALRAVDIPVPDVYLVDPDRLCIWTEDFGDDFLNCRSSKNTLDIDDPACTETYGFYLQSLDLLIKAQYPVRPIPPHPAERLAFDHEKLHFEMRFFVKHFLNGLLGMTTDENGDGAEGRTLSADFHRLCETLGQCERVLCHRDYHVRNVMISKGQAKWIDFQDARMGPHTYDVVSLVRDSYMILTQKTRQELYAYYFAGLNRARARCGLPAIPPDQFQTEAAHMGLQRNVKALGSFGYLATQKGKPSYLGYVFQTLDTLLAPESLGSSRERLDKIYPSLFGLLRSLREGVLRKTLEEAIARKTGSA